MPKSREKFCWQSLRRRQFICRLYIFFALKVVNAIFHSDDYGYITGNFFQRGQAGRSFRVSETFQTSWGTIEGPLNTVVVSVMSEGFQGVFSSIGHALLPSYITGELFPTRGGWAKLQSLFYSSWEPIEGPPQYGSAFCDV